MGFASLIYFGSVFALPMGIEGLLNVCATEMNFSFKSHADSHCEAVYSLLLSLRQ